MCRWRWCPGGVRLQLVGAVLLLLQTAALCSQPGSCACQRQRCLSEQRLGALLCTCGWYASLCRCCCLCCCFIWACLLVQMEGPCLVVLTDGTVAQSYIPDNDFR